MSDVIIVSLISLAGTFLTVFSGVKLITYRIDQLEKKVEKHNQFYDRIYTLEKNKDVNAIEHSNFDRRISNIERSL